MPTAQAIFSQAWVDLGVGAPGQIPNASQSVNGLNKLNLFIDMLSGMREAIYQIALSSYILNSSGQYLIGPTAPAPFNVPRPLKVETADILINIPAVGLQSSPLHIMTEDEWRMIRDNTAVGLTPEDFYIDPGVPISTIYLHPKPNCVIQTLLQLGTWTAISQFTTLGTNLNLPPTYYNVLVLGLQLALAPTYGNLINPVILQMRQQQFAAAWQAMTALNATVQRVAPAPPPAQTAPATSPSGSNPQLAQLLQELRTSAALQRQG